ncbi:hypothetical protein DIURU_001739 [Diutina rugosa]|uniref:Uncharacterized protein n=1 Tax=Diutina rugosa TaxID=5481 RepID=A0A642USZ7_DIURU|nr:uncharacterized protein DIURU_001739 [Diutina rugosa]KAA8904903.1 hypothetical protein DIURU_001739 [Diutina rugosa]
MTPIRLSSYAKVAARCWVPVKPTTVTRPVIRQFSNQRAVFASEGHVVCNDNIYHAAATEHDDAPFEPTVSSEEDIHTAGPVNKA